MPYRDYGQGATPGVPRSPLTREPVGTRGELTPGPDHLDPDVPEEREELRRLGYRIEPVDELADLGVMDDGPPERQESSGGVLPRLSDHPLFG